MQAFFFFLMNSGYLKNTHSCSILCLGFKLPPPLSEFYWRSILSGTIHNLPVKI